MVELRKVVSRGRLTIPKAIREQFCLSEGDAVVFAAEDDRIVLRKLTLQDDDYLRRLEETFPEWLSEEDERAYRSL